MKAIAVVLAVGFCAVTWALVELQPDPDLARYQYAFHRDHDTNPELCIVTGMTDAILDTRTGTMYLRTWMVYTSITGTTESVTYKKYQALPEP